MSTSKLLILITSAIFRPVFYMYGSQNELRTQNQALSLNFGR